MGATKQLAEYLINTKYDDLPKEAVDRAKELILNFLGVAMDGSKAEVSQIVMKRVKSMEAKAEASVIGGDYKTTTALAAYVNGTSVHANELEAVGMCFNSGPTMAPALALTETRGLSGKELIAGFVLGYDVQGRVINGTRNGIGNKGWIMPLNHVGAASAAAKLTGLDPEQAAAAIGTVLAEASGMQSSAGSLNHYLAFSFPALNAVDAAAYAKEGLGGNPDVLDVKDGFCDFFAGLEDTDFAEMTKDLGKDFSTLTPPGTGIKKYPCCFVAHKAVDSFVELIQEYNIEYDDVEYVQVDTNEMVLGWLQYPEPSTVHHGRFSMPHIMATCLKNKGVWMDTMTGKGVAQDPEYIEAREKIRVVLNPEFAAGVTAGWRTPVKVKMKDGKEYTREVNPVKELDHDGVLDLHRRLLKPYLSDDKIEQSIEMVENLENLDKIDQLIGLFT
jgi:2-methylcitrate dehydratase PrpD